MSNSSAGSPPSVVAVNVVHDVCPVSVGPSFKSLVSGCDYKSRKHIPLADGAK